MPTRRQSATAALVLLSCATATLTACTSAEPAAPPTATARTAPSSAPPRATAPADPTQTPTSAATAVTKPTPPPALDEPPDDNDAAAVAEYFVLLYPYMNLTEDTSQWDALTSPECDFCADAVDEVAARAAAGQHVEGGAAVVHQTSAISAPGDEWLVDVDVADEPSRTVDSNGVTVDESAGGIHHLLLSVRWVGDRWYITSFGSQY